MLHLFAALVLACPQTSDTPYERALERAGDNRAELEDAWIRLPEPERRGLEFLVEHMPQGDLEALTADFLVEHVSYAYQAKRTAPWAKRLDEALFLEYVLPYASINERRDAWRRDFFERFRSVVAEAKTPGEAAARLNNHVFPELGVIYSTKRPKADQSPYESIEAGMASCTGLSVLLIDACRAVGVPARFVGTPRWSDDSGNHSWVEVWDDGWHFTGAAEPTGERLDEAWFTARAQKAKRDSERYGIFAVSYKRTPQRFPMVWRPEADYVYAVNVTDRYTKGQVELPEGHGRVRFRVVDLETNQRVRADVRLELDGGWTDAGQTNDERFDANDHLELVVPLGRELAYEIRVGSGSMRGSTLVQRDEQLIDLEVRQAGEGLSKEAADDLIREVTERRRNAEGEALAEARDRLESKSLVTGEHTMPIWWKTYGDAPANGHSLWISMHGGGGAPARVNDGQWENQKRLYELEEGIYVAPRAPTDTWNLWHQAHVDVLFDQLIRDMILVHGVDPDRVYLTGYSAGGDGVYQLAPRMADRFAAAAMMAGHPNDAKPLGLRNLAFTLHMGAKDGAYKRNEVAAQWKERLADLRQADENGYDHWVQIHEGKGHWMDRQDAAALPWMAKRTRNLRPQRIVWLQSGVTHERFYWLFNPDPKRGAKLVVEREGQTIRIVEAMDVATLRIRLDDSMLDLDQPVRVVRGDQELWNGLLQRRAGVIEATLAERGDSRGVFTTELEVVF